MGHVNDLDDLPDLDLSLDPHTIDEHWLDQPNMMLVWTGHAAAAVLAVDQARAKLEVSKAIAAREIAANPADYDLGRATVDAVAAMVLEQAEVKIATKRWHEAKYRSAMVAGAVNAVEDRRRALQKLVELEGHAGYEPKAPIPKGVRKRGK